MEKQLTEFEALIEKLEKEPSYINPEIENLFIKVALEEEAYIGRGSSRAVYSLGNGYCIKVAFDAPGQHQNSVEVDTFWEHGDSHLARIIGWGEFIVVMEEIEALELDDVMDLIHCFNEYGSCEGRSEYSDERSDEDYQVSSVNRNLYSEDEILELEEAYEFLSHVLGETDDNFQLGFTYNRKAVAYDYGYQSGDHQIAVSQNLGMTIQDIGEYDFLQEVGQMVQDLI